MQRGLKFILPVMILTGAFLLNQFSCLKNDATGPVLFGNTEESPLKAEAEKTRAYEIQNAFTKIYNMYKESVVFITTEQFVSVQPHPFFNDPRFRQFFRQPRGEQNRVQKRTGLGTGFILSRDGYICTNHHVVASVDNVFVKINEKSYKAEIIGSDKRTDIALLKIKAPGDLKPVYFGDSDKINVGDWAIAIGNPFGLDRTFTVGVISALGRNDVDLMGGNHIQTDASINPGNSGGPLINIFGEVVGINRMIYSKSGGYMGIGFAIPINTARSILAQLKEFREVKRGYLGVSILELNEGTARDLGLNSAKGAFIGEVVKGSPAGKGGINAGDVILALDDVPIKTYKDLLNIIGQTPIGKRLKVTVWRNKRKLNIYVKIVERPRG